MNYYDLIELIKTQEGYTLEFKESLNHSIGREICALANASGGKIILGVKDDGTISGYHLTNKDKSIIQDTARNMDPALHLIIEKVSNLAVIYVPEGKEKPYTVNGHFYLRQGSNSQQLRRNEIRDLFQKENLVRFDRKANSDFNFTKDFDNKKFEAFVVKAGLDNSLPELHLLNNLGLMTEDRLNNTGVLFFAHTPSKFFLNSIIGCVLYKGKSKLKILDKKELDDDFVSNFNNAVIFTLRNLRTEYIIEKITREEKPEISEEVLRELIINAMIHRDYFSEGRVIVEIFSDRIEISNPGSLLFDKKELGNISLSRNPLLVDLVHRLDLVEKIGSGINKVRKILEGEIKFELSSNWFRVIIKRKSLPEFVREDMTNYIIPSQKPAKNQPKTSQKPAKNKRKLLILEAIKNNQFRKRSFSQKLGVNKSTIESDLEELKQERKINFKGPKKGGHWEIL
ncbi:MAG: hypothetical protein A2298_02105 [Gammaproteobacteria bacterium RIFOXYB2_FULL_38_6]|nr:MAG: hypothetical protein A2298_02105 [Gammaproteobacteria bacterium RIFOXYB2_FULL_38_6]